MEPQLHDLGAALRSEIRLEAEEAERDAARSAAMGRTLRDVAADLMAHGDTVVAHVSGQHTVEGAIVHVGADFLAIENRHFRTDIRLDALAHVGVAHRALAGGRGPSRREAPAWRARLLELELGGRRVRLGLRGLEEELVGTVALVGADHLALAGPARDPERFVPFASVAYVRTGRADGQEDADV
ncbi:MAG: hypothetical protein ACRDJO_04320 [Actinomycetota bacterium]